jgi:hypothetical protein
MDLTYHTELRELNELNAARLEAHVSQQLAEAKHQLRREVAELRSEVREGFANARADSAALEARIVSRLVRWMFVFWTGTTITLLGAIFAITRL